MIPRRRRGQFALRRRLAVLVLFLVLTASTRPAWTDPWYEHYEKAERALETENWEEAVVQINQAIETERAVVEAGVADPRTPVPAPPSSGTVRKVFSTWLS